MADTVQAAVGKAYDSLGRPGRALKDVLHGTLGLGHPLHPALSDVPIGAWSTGVVADYAALLTRRVPRVGGDLGLAFGLVSAVPTALSGLTDYHETYGHERRVATVHGIAMVTAVTLDAASLGLRLSGSEKRQPLAVALSTAGLAVVLIGGFLGGHLVFGSGTMVNRNAFAEGPEDDFIPVGASADFAEGALRRVDLNGMPALVVRRTGTLHAIAAVCSHAGGPLDEGQLDGSQVTCPWHGSVFSVEDGRVLHGPATLDQPAFIVRELDGRVELKLETPLH
ncbi:MAG: Rieske 2Fe-2S domain-containing protein [Candidatus Dormibacteria bacterium]